MTERPHDAGDVARLATLPGGPELARLYAGMTDQARASLMSVARAIAGDGALRRAAAGNGLELGR